MTYKSFVPDSYNWIVGPNYRLGEKEFRVVYRDYAKLGLLRHCRKSYNVKQGNMRIETPWSAVIEVVSADNQDSLLGEGLSHAIMSEAAKHDVSTWEQYIEPALSDLLGTCDFPSTPKGFNWYHGLWELGQGHHDYEDTYKSWHFPSWENTVRYPGGFQNGEIQRLFKVASPKWFQQEYGAQFTAIAGSIYDEWDDDVHIQPHIFRPDWPNYQAYDYGYANAFVCLDIQVSPSDDVFVWREYYSSGKATMEHGTYLAGRENPPGYRVDGRWGDPRGADEAATLALVYGYVASQDVPWKWGVEEIKRMLKAKPPKLYVSPDCINLKRQMNQLHVKPVSKQTKQDIQETAGDGNIQHKVDDHAVDALRYFIGPHFVLGMDLSLEDLYGNQYVGSESEAFFNLRTQVTLDNSNIHLGRMGYAA